MSFIQELKRRNVFRVGIAYVLIAWVLLQGADFGLDLIDAPNWVIQVLFLLAAIALPAALIFAWVFEMTPEGIKREADIDREQSVTPGTGRKLDRVIIAFLALAVVILLADKFMPGEPETLPAQSQTGQMPSVPAEAPAPEAKSSSEKSIAVLPFVNMSSDTEQQYFSDGITEEIINALVRIPGLKVAARTSVFAFKGQQKDVRETGRDLDVAHVLEGSVRSDGQQLRITAQLIQVDDGFHLWSETFDRERVNVFAIQEEIANAIAEVLTEQFGFVDATQGGSSVAIEVYDDYLRGRAHLRARTDEDLDQALALFRGVVEAAPDYAPGWAALAITTDVMDDHETAERAAQRALEIEPDNVDALNALGAVYRDTWRWQQARDTLERAVAIDPGSAELLEDYAEFLASTGRVEEQLIIAERGYRVDPYLDPLEGVYAQALISTGRAQEAIEVLDRALARGAADWLYHTKMMALSETGDIEAMRSLLLGLDFPENYLSAFLSALERPDDPETFVEMRQLELSGPLPPENPLLGAIFEFLYLRLGHPEILIDGELERFSSDNWGSAEYWSLPTYAGFRSHPRFADLLELTGLPTYWDQAGWPDYCKRVEENKILCH